MDIGIAGLAGLVIPLLSIPFYLIARLRSRQSGGGRIPVRPWILTVLGTSVVCFVLGWAASLHYGSVLNGRAASPSPADAAYIASYFLLTLGTIFWTEQKLAVASRMRIMADRLMILSAAGTFSWYLIIGPILTSNRLSPSAQLTETVYASFDLIFIFCLLVLASRFRVTEMRLAISLLGLAMVTLLLSHSLLAYRNIHGGDQLSSWQYLTWPCSYLLVGLAGVCLRFRVRWPHTSKLATSVVLPRTEGTPNLWRYLLPYALIPGVVALMIYEAHFHTSMFIEVGVYIMASLMIEMVFVHQFLAFRELTSHANRSARLESLASADPVTGLPNHRSVVDTLDTMLRRAGMEESKVGILFLDLDYFKVINDRFGHSAGDGALREFAAVVRTALREVDTIGRWGGEEFVALLPATNDSVALMVAERIRAVVAEHVFQTVRGLRVTCSIGVAVYPLNGTERGILMEAADTAMYAAKQKGRNCVCVAGHSDSSNQHSAKTREEASVEAVVIALRTLAGLNVTQDDKLVELVRQMAQLLDMDAAAIRSLGIRDTSARHGDEQFDAYQLHASSGIRRRGIS